MACSAAARSVQLRGVEDLAVLGERRSGDVLGRLRHVEDLAVVGHLQSAAPPVRA
jgi:hypothetical protein